MDDKRGGNAQFATMQMPPTADDLSGYRDVDVTELPEKFLRPLNDRVFSNRALRMDQIKVRRRRRRRRHRR